MAFTLKRCTDSPSTLSIIEGTKVLQSIPVKYREAVENVVLMLVPPADIFGAFITTFVLSVVQTGSRVCVCRSFESLGTYPQDKPIISSDTGLLLHA